MIQISEFQPNPPSSDPSTQTIELSGGTPGTSFNGFIVSIESDTFNGTIERLNPISGTFDANGLLAVDIPDLENPSFTLVLTENDLTASLGDDIDPANDGSATNAEILGTVLDAIGVPDSGSDAGTLYGVTLGGTDFAFTGTEPELIFRAADTGVLYAVNDLDANPPVIIDAAGNNVNDDPDADSDNIAFTSDPTATTFGSENPSECFLVGTKVLTEKGEVAVEDLEIGNLVKTAEGKLECIKWIGVSTIDPKAPHHPFRSLPIQIKAGALGDSLPTHDLFVSPDHAILVGGLLINAGALENGTSIVATQPKETFTYYHIELEQHSLLIAEGTYAESYLPQNQARDTFDNGDEYEELYPNHNILSLLPMSFPRVSSKRQLPRCVAKQLAEVAKTLPNVGAGAVT